VVLEYISPKFQFEILAMILVVVILFTLHCANAAITLDCAFGMRGFEIVGSQYNCLARVTQNGPSRSVVAVIGNHQAGRSHRDVLALTFITQQIDRIPQNMISFFPNVETIRIDNCPIQSFTRDDLRPFPRLRYFVLHRSQVRTINGDVFMHSPQLQFLWLGNNQITNVGPGLLQHSPRITRLYFPTNPCISSSATTAAAIANLGRDLAFRCPPTVEMTEEIILQGSNFQAAVCTAMRRC